jgi:hypothetical protein
MTRRERELSMVNSHEKSDEERVVVVGRNPEMKEYLA